MEYIGKRISFKRKEDGELSIVVLSTADTTKKKLLLLWLVLWTIGGLLVFSQYFTMADKDTKAAIIVWMGFWAYFEYKVTKVFLWRNSGMEKIKIRKEKLFYKRDISGRGKIKVYDTEMIKDLRVVEPKENSFFEDLNNSYWVIAGEKLAFDHFGKEVKFGIQLEETDAKALHKLINKEISGVAG